MKEFEVWIKIKRCPHLLGKFKAESFEDACKMAKKTYGLKHKIIQFTASKEKCMELL